MSEHKEPSWERKRRERAEAGVRVMNLLQQIEGHLGGILSATLAVPRGDLLMQGVVAIGPEGFWTRSWPEAFAAVEVLAWSTTGTITVAAAGPAGGVPSQGANVARVPANAYRVLNLRGSALTLYGAPGDLVDVTVYVRPRPPAASIGEGSSAPQVVSLEAQAADVALLGTAGWVRRVSVAESTGTAGATVKLHDGSSTAGVVVDVITLTAGESTRDHYALGEYPLLAGLYLEIVSGSVDIVAVVQEF
jgi:hypothetical protein